MGNVRPDISGVTTDDDLVQLWLQGRPASTTRSYATVVTAFRSVVCTGLRGLTASDLITWRGGLVGADATRAHAVCTIKSLLTFAWRVGFTGVNVGRILKCPKVVRRLHEHFIEEDEVRAVLGTAHPGRDQAFVRLLYTAGLRISEAVGLRLIDLGKGRIQVVGKGSKERTVVVPNALISALKALCPQGAAPCGRIFRNYRGEPLSIRGAREIVYETADRAGLKVKPHTLRHAHATHAMDHGCDLNVLSKSLGHANIATTSVYLHARPNAGSSQYLADV